MHDAAILRRLDRLIWAIAAAVAFVVLAAPLVSNFHLDAATFMAPAGACLALAGAAWFYRSQRNDLRIASGLESTAQLIAFTAVGAPLSYLAAAAGAMFPLQDSMFDAVDRALGFDWRNLLVWMNNQKAAHSVFMLSYMSFTLQASVTILALAFCGHLVRLRVFLIALALSAIVCMAISALLPAEGIWGYYKLTATDHPAIIPATRELHLPIFHGLRDGTFRALTGLNSEGIITFPSFHAALGVIFMVALWPVPVLRWFGVAMNGAMIVATPIDGGHYFIDVLAGIVVAILCIMAGYAMAARAGFAPGPVAVRKIPQAAAGD
jgi:hypothetical protein